jgi:hypothetical protein
MQFTTAFRLDPIIMGPPRAGVILAYESTPLKPVAARWAVRVPAAAFIGLQCANDTAFTVSRESESALLARAARALESMFEHQAQSLRLNGSQLVVVGFGNAGTVALHLVLHQGWSCAGVLTFGAKVLRPLPRRVSNLHKVRLIGHAKDARPTSLRDDVALLIARGIDARGVLASVLSTQEALRHGAAYLVELVATAQGSSRFPARRDIPDLRSKNLRTDAARRQARSASSSRHFWHGQGPVIELTQDNQRRYQCDDFS